MPNANNSPAGGTGDDVSTADIVDELAGILDDPAEDHVEDEGNDAVDKAADKEKDGEEPDESEEAAEDDAEDPETGDKSKQASEPDADKGRFVADSAKVKLEDGRVVSVGELRKSPMFQGDYTRKTQELADNRKAFEAERQRNSQQAQQLEQVLAENLEWLGLTKPERPAVSYEDDPVAYLRYQDDMQRWIEARQWVGQKVSTLRATTEKAQKDALADYEKREDEALRTAIPALRDQAKYRAFVAEVEKIAPDYGITPEELKGVKDHRQWLVLRDALAYRRLKTMRPETKKAVESKPAMLMNSKRTNPKQAQDRVRRDRTERLRNEGTFDAGVAALMDLDL